jgi:hypothetical protein
MQERSGTVVGALVLLLLILPLGFVIHVSPRFPGSLAGTLTGIAGAVLMLVALAYVPIKRVPAIHDRITRIIPARTLLAIHIYAGVLGPILGLVHAAHKFSSPLGVSLTGIMILVVITGYVSRYLLVQVARAVRGRKADLASLKATFAALPPAEVRTSGESGPVAVSRTRRALLGFLFASSESAAGADDQASEAAELAGAIADTEYAIRSEEVTSSLFGASLNVHIAVAIILFALLALHIWSGIYYGLRWL